jgi:hypothetical protein
MPFINSVRGNFSPVGRPRKPKNSANGGSESTVQINGKRYRVHVFTSSTNINVITGIDPFTVFVMGGGAGGGYGLGGGAGYFTETSINIPSGVTPVTVGPGVTGGYDEVTNRDASGNDGNSSSIGSIISASGGGSRGGRVGFGATTSITGSPVSYGGSGGACLINQNANTGGYPGGGVGGSTGTSATLAGGGGGGCQWTSGGGARGEVIIRYEID